MSTKTTLLFCLISLLKIHFLLRAGLNDDAILATLMAIPDASMAASSSSSESSEESGRSLELSYSSDGDAEPEPERMRPFLYEPVVSDDDESSEASEDDPSRLVDSSW